MDCKVIILFFIFILEIPVFGVSQTWSQVYEEENVVSEGYSIHELEENLLVEYIQAGEGNQRLILKLISKDTGFTIFQTVVGNDQVFTFPGGNSNVFIYEDKIFAAITTENDEGYWTSLYQFDFELNLINSLEILRGELIAWNSVYALNENEIYVSGFKEGELDEIILEKISFETGVIDSHIYGANELEIGSFGFRCQAVKSLNDTSLILDCRKLDPESYNDCSWLSFDTGRLLLAVNLEGDLEYIYDGDDNCHFDYFPRSESSDVGTFYGCGNVDLESNCDQSYDCYLQSLTSLSSSNQVEWSLTFGAPSITSFISDITLSGDDIIASGSRWNMTGGKMEGTIHKANIEGEESFSRFFRYDSLRPSGLNGVCSLADGRIAATGYAEESQLLSNKSLWVVMLDSDGCLEEDCGVNVQEITSEILKIYPNPSDGIITVEWGQFGQLGARLLLSTMTGQVLLEEEIVNSNNFKIDTANIVSGFYLVKIESSDRSFTKRVIISH